MNLKTVIEDTDTTAGKAFNLSIQFLIIFSLVCFSIETLPGLSAAFRTALYIAEAVTVVIFTVEYALRLYVADSKLRFVFSFYGLVDLFAILPFYLSTSIDLRSIRVFRMLRLFRIFKLLRYGKAVERFRNAFIDIKEELVVFLTATVLVIYVSSVGIYYFESNRQPDEFGSVFHCMWWAIVTLTTVGYGYTYPVTLGGRMFTGIVLFMGLGLIAVPSGLFASALAKADRD
jgi:voltage-gated potassium channel